MTNLNTHSHTRFVWLCAFLCILIVKCVLLMQHTSPVFIDEVVYADIAGQTAYHGSLKMACPFMFQRFPWAYSVVLSPACFLSYFTNMTGVLYGFHAINLLLSAICAVVAYYICRIFTHKYARWCALLTFIALPVVGYTPFLLSENLFTPAFLLCLLSLTKIYLSQSKKVILWSSICGFSIALLYFTRNVSGALLCMSAFFILLLFRRWLAFLWTGIFTALFFSLFMIPEYFLGDASFNNYWGRHTALLDVAKNLITNPAMLKDAGYVTIRTILYTIVVTGIVPFVAVFITFKRLSKPFQFTVAFLLISYMFTLPVSILHCFTEIPENLIYHGRHFDSITSGIFVIGIIAIMHLKKRDTLLLIISSVSVVLLCSVFTLRSDWWMETLPLTFLRYAARMNYEAFLLIGAGVSVMLLGWLCCFYRKAAYIVGTISLLSITTVNAIETFRYTNMMKKIADAVLKDIETDGIVKRETLTKGAQKDVDMSYIYVLADISTYFWTLNAEDGPRTTKIQQEMNHTRSHTHEHHNHHHEDGHEHEHEEHHHEEQ